MKTLLKNIDTKIQMSDKALIPEIDVWLKYVSCPPSYKAYLICTGSEQNEPKTRLARPRSKSCIISTNFKLLPYLWRHRMSLRIYPRWQTAQELSEI